MFLKHSDDGYNHPLDGIEQKTLVYGEKTLMSEFRLQKGSAIPLHSHPYEQTGYLLSGRIRLFVGASEFDVQPGDSWNIPPDVGHRAEIIENAVAVEVFSPVREDYLPEGLPQSSE